MSAPSGADLTVMLVRLGVGAAVALLAAVMIADLGTREGPVTPGLPVTADERRLAPAPDARDIREAARRLLEEGPDPVAERRRFRLEPGRRVAADVQHTGILEVFDRSAMGDFGDDEASTDAGVRAQRSGTTGEARGLISIASGDPAARRHVPVDVRFHRTPQPGSGRLHHLEVRRGRLLIESPGLEGLGLSVRIPPRRDLQARVAIGGSVRVDLWPAPPGSRPRDLLP